MVRYVILVYLTFRWTIPSTLSYSAVCPRCARFRAVTLKRQPLLTHESRCIHLAGLVNVIIMCPLSTVECLVRRPSRLLKPSSPVNKLLQPAWGNSALGGEALSWLAITDGTSSSAPFSFFYEKAVSWRQRWGQWRGAGSSSPHHCIWHFALRVVCPCVFAHVHLCVMCI